MSPISGSRSVRTVLVSAALCGALVASAGTASAGTALAGTALAGTASAGTASADHRAGARPSPVPTPGEREVLLDGLVGPLSLSVGPHDSVYVSQDFGNEIGVVSDGTYATLVAAEDGADEHAGVSSVGRTLYYVTSDFPDEGSTDPVDAHLWQRDRRGEVTRLADLGAHEVTENPDAVTTYGFTSLPEGCEVPEGYPFRYAGVVESHPYATTPYRGSVLVADAAGNDILRVDRRGDVHTVAVLPPIPLMVTAELAAGVGFPECTAGATYLLEPVPTDVEVGPDGWLYVSALPGGPELPDLALGIVFRVHPRTGAVHQVATGLVSATGLAVGTKGEIYVAELFANRISVIPRGSSTPQPFLTDLTLPAAVEVEGRALYVTVDALPGPDAPPDGTVVKVELRR